MILQNRAQNGFTKVKQSTLVTFMSFKHPEDKITLSEERELCNLIEVNVIGIM